jgi:hypothetical protein
VNEEALAHWRAGAEKKINLTKSITTPIHVVSEYNAVLQIKHCTEELTDITDLHSKWTR